MAGPPVTRPPLPFRDLSARGVWCEGSAGTGSAVRRHVRWREAAQAHSTSVSRSHRLPPPVVPDLRLPPVMLLPGHIRAHDAKCSAVGNTLCTDLSEDDFGGALPDSGDGIEAVACRAVLGHQCIDALI